eukprot:m.380153 g.380153  ORF g.380153 m.380153 type:complete len:386 (-) comp20034_c0_seq4:32-1189(-)
MFWVCLAYALPVVPLVLAALPTRLSPIPKRASDAWVCARSNPLAGSNLNTHITDKLEGLLELYDKTNKKDHFRIVGLQRVVGQLKRLPQKVTCIDDVKGKLWQAGAKTLQKIEEILRSGHLRRIDELRTPEQEAEQLFSRVWGIGAATAKKFVARGLRTLDDLKMHATGLTASQRIGLQLFDELEQRIPRSEVEEMVAVVRNEAELLAPGVELEACGSFRRGKATCGDVDILITHRDGISYKGLMQRLVKALTNNGFLRHDLSVPGRFERERQDPSTQDKYMGVSCLGPGRLHRRLDLIVVPPDEWPCALLYFTGSGHFNRSMRLLAKQNGMTLSQHGLNREVHRHPKASTTKLYTGIPVVIGNEADVFKALQIPYRSPEERNAG